MIGPLAFEGERGANSSGFSPKALRSTKGSGVDRTESAVVFYFNATGHLTRVSLEITGHPGAVMPVTTDYELGEARH